MMRPWNDFPQNAELCCQARIEPEEIGYVCALVEALEGLAIIRTKDKALGIVEFWISPAMKADFAGFLAGLAREISISIGTITKLDSTALTENV